eukprot:CAMPEP_0115851648 /NCGR_PEP_ID=MMETSP0287-20121206/12590_1 /TAXON_ID=412157 /ORGANISM="Chrysochromulina rotalis, Strain UIO044" /LENGTH=254 /DNA_ID=CAMNT_0003305687 /DNA_START=12 /DNA_END=776 /DNA_ORIENTATION=+
MRLSALGVRLLLLVAGATGFAARPQGFHLRSTRRSLPVYASAASPGDSEACIAQLAQDNAPGKAIEEAAAELVARGGGLEEPALSPMIGGEWKLLHISSSDFDIRNPLGRRIDGTLPGVEGWIAKITGGGSVASASSSPIQRAVTDAFSVTQSIELSEGTPRRGRVEQLVRTPLGELHLNAAATVDPSQPERISFTFDEGFFAFRESGLRVPYPVPFRLLGKEAEGFLDTLYLGERLRISKGNKGSTFVLERAL